MDQREKIIQLTQAGLSPKDIQEQLKDEYGKHAYGISAIYKWHARAITGHTDITKHEKPGFGRDEQLLVRIEQVLHDEPYASVRKIAHILGETPSIIWRYMTEELHFQFKAARWVPHSLTNEQKNERIEKAKELYDILTQARHETFANIITGDESMFQFYYGINGVWLHEEEEPIEVEKSRMCVKKLMLTVMWGIKGMYLIDFLPEHQKFNSEYFIANILTPIGEMKKSIWPRKSSRLMWLHLDNCRIHNSKAAAEKVSLIHMKRAPQPAYSPDLAPSDFFLFGYVKSQLKGASFKTREQLQSKIIQILNAIPSKMIRSVFEEWINRCQWVFQHKGEYYHK